jgi:hypothetical protein
VDKSNDSGFSFRVKCEGFVWFLPFHPGSVSDLADIVGSDIENPCDVLGRQPSGGVDFGEFREENSLTVAQIKGLSFAAAEQYPHILSCHVTGI